MALFREQSDVSVRPATSQDPAHVVVVQLAAWRATHLDVLGEGVLDRLDPAAMRDQWERAITAPPSAQHRVLVACEGARVVGLATTAPAPDGGVEILALEVHPEHRRAGHGSRLLTACVDLAREHGPTHLLTWVLDGDDARGSFLSSSGMAADGAVRTLATGPDGEDDPRTVREHRWVAEL